MSSKAPACGVDLYEHAGKYLDGACRRSARPQRSESIALGVDGARIAAPITAPGKLRRSTAKRSSITNQGSAAGRDRRDDSGNPFTPEPAARQGYQLERAYYSLAGKKIDPAAIKQNDRFIVALKVTERTRAYARLLLDRSSAGRT